MQPRSLARSVDRAHPWFPTVLVVLVSAGLLRCAGGEKPDTGQGPGGTACVPGDQKACACPGGTMGVQVCADDGTKYGLCTGCEAPATGGSVGSGGAPGSGGSGPAATGGRAGGGGAGVTGGAVGTGGGAGRAGTGGGTGGLGPIGGGPASGGAGGRAPGSGGSVGTGGSVGSGGRQGGTGGGFGGAGGAPPSGVALVPDNSGFVLAGSNTLGVQGPWYAFGDGIGPDGATATGICERGGHPVIGCSAITTPQPGPFTNTGGRMCTSGVVAQVVNNAMGMLDYANITGAGIGLDLANSGTVRGVFNATGRGVTGVSFEIDAVPAPGLRVELPIPATEGSAAGAAYWGANAVFANSPVAPGLNVLRWADVRVPGVVATPVFDPTMIESILFHVPSTASSTGPYAFCISNLKLLMP